MARITSLPQRLNGSRQTAACITACRQGHFGAAHSLVQLIGQHPTFEREPAKACRQLDPDFSLSELLSYCIAYICLKQHGPGHNCQTVAMQYEIDQKRVAV